MQAFSPAVSGRPEGLHYFSDFSDALKACVTAISPSPPPRGGMMRRTECAPMRMLAVTMISAATLAVGLHALGQSASETVDAHVAAAKAAAGQEHTGLFNAACAPTSIRPVAAGTARTARRWRRRRPARPARSGAVARRAGEGLRQSVFRRPERVLGVGGHDLGGDHPHRYDLRLLGRGRSGRRAHRSSASIRLRSSTSSSAMDTRIIPAAPSSCRSGSARGSFCRPPTGICSIGAPARNRSATWWSPTARSSRSATRR